MGILSNYCGFGGKGVPQHKVDAICKQHDENYDLILKNGDNPYTNWNWADEIMVQQLQELDMTDANAKEQLLKFISETVQTIKHAITPDLAEKQRQRLRKDHITPDKRKDHESDEHKTKKRLRFTSSSSEESKEDKDLEYEHSRS